MPQRSELNLPALEWDTAYPPSSVPRILKWRPSPSRLFVPLCQVSKEEECNNEVGSCGARGGEGGKESESEGRCLMTNVSN